MPVYHIKFLGKFLIYKNQRYLKAKLSPKEQAFLIFLALKASEPQKFILLSDLYQNFWAQSKDSANMLLHLLAQLKKKLVLPGYLLGISSRYVEPRCRHRNKNA